MLLSYKWDGIGIGLEISVWGDFRSIKSFAMLIMWQKNFEEEADLGLGMAKEPPI